MSTIPVHTNSSQGQNISLNIWKLITAIFITSLIIIFGPQFLAELSLMPPIIDKSYLILAVTSAVLVIKMLLGDMVSGDFKYYKHGYDLCILTFGAVLSSFSLQIIAEHDLFPSLTSVAWLAPIRAMSDNLNTQRIIMLFCFFLLASVATLFTATIAKLIREVEAGRQRVHFCNGLAALNLVVGAFLLSLYIFILITKG